MGGLRRASVPAASGRGRGVNSAAAGRTPFMDRDISQEHDQEGSEDGSGNEEQSAARHTEGSDLDEEQEETGEGILDHPEHSDAPGPFGTS